MFTFQATPAVSVSVDGNVIGNTPLTQTLSQCRAVAGFTGGAPHQITFNAAVPYTVPVVQANNGNRTIYFNANTDTQNNARIGTIALSAARVPQSAGGTAPSNANRRPLQGGYHLGEIVPDGFYVKAQNTAGAVRSLRELDVRSATRVSDLGEIEPATIGRVVTIAPGADLQAAMASYRRIEGVTSVSPLHVRRPMSVPLTAQVTPNDTYFKPYEQWDMYQIGMPSAWAYTKGAGATIAVIDTGVDSKQNDIGPVGATNKLTFAETVLSGTTSVGATTDSDGHGTNVAGIAGAITNNAFGFAGVGYNVSLQAYKVIGGSTGSTADEAIAIGDAVKNGADVINLSLGGADFDQVEHDAVISAINNGVVVVAAAGNCGYVPSSGCDGAVNVLDYPAGYDGVISVGASAYNDSNTMLPGTGTEFVPGYSQGASNLSLVAPGGGARGQGGDITAVSDNDLLHWIYNIYSTTGSPACSDPKNCKALFVGTSQATPHVAGAAALVVAAKGRHVLSPAQIKTLLESTADDISDPKQGHGRLNVYRALAAATGDTAPPSYTPVASQFVAFAYANSGSTVPQILDVNYPKGVPVGTDGTFRIADVSPVAIGATPGATSYKVAVWYDANGDGVIDAGDEFGYAPNACNTGFRCSPGTINVTRVSAGFVLP
ncbi:MAG: hypothetical protein NVSMB5_18300 [Candidatus Velthaea sp.]